MRKLLTCVVTKKVTRGIATRVTKEELWSNKAYIDTRGTAKEEVIEGNPKRTNLIEASIYDTKPVHCNNMVTYELKLVVK